MLVGPDGTPYTRMIVSAWDMDEWNKPYSRRIVWFLQSRCESNREALLESHRSCTSRKAYPEG
jgi:hypothetical protein